MSHRTFTLMSIAAGFCWIAGVTLAVVDPFTEVRLLALVVVLVALGATLVILESIERNAQTATSAFQLGQDSAGGSVRSLRD